MDLSSLSTRSNAANALAGLILVSPQNIFGITAQLNPNTIPITSVTRSLTNSTTFIFNYEGENSVTLESDITDHYVEDNTAINDQISLKPEIVSTHGYIGELNDITPPLLAPLKLAADTLTALSPYRPSLSITALRAYNNALFAYQTAAQLVNSAVGAIGTIAGGPIQNQQQKAFAMFYGYYRQRQLFTVNTPWGQFKDMAIKTLRAVQDEDTNVITDFEITFKKMRFANSVVTTPNLIQGRADNMASPTVNLGVGTLANPATFNPAAVA